MFEEIARKNKLQELTNAINIRMIELVAIFCIVYLARELAGFTYRTDLVVFLFMGAALLNFIVAGLEGFVLKDNEKGINLLNWLAIGVDLATVLSLVYLTGSAWSPFLFLVILPLFFSSRLIPSISTGIILTLVTVTIIGALSLLEINGSIAHFSCYQGDYSSIMNEHFLTGTLLALAGFMGLMIFLFNTYHEKFRVYFRSAEKKIEQSRKRILELTRLYDISLGINSVISLETLMKMVCKETTLLLRRPWAGAVLLTEKHEVFKYIELDVNDGSSVKQTPEMKEDPLIKEVVELKEGLLINSIKDHPSGSASRLLKGNKLKSLLAIPVISNDTSLGIIMVGDVTGEAFTEEDLKLLTILSGQVAGAIEKSKLHEVMNRRIDKLETDNENLESSNKLKMGYISHLSHELKTPLTSIKAYVESLLEHMADSDFKEREEFLGVISNETERLIRMVNKVLDVSKIKFGRKALKRKVFHLKELIQNVESSMQPYFKDKDLRLIVNISDEIPGVDGDEDLIKQVFINLVGNAIKFSPARGKIYIEAAEDAVSIRVSVRDEGKGISKNKLKNVFKRFYQAHAGFNEGVGLGLAIVKNIVEQHGGYIKVTSEIDEGTEFIFTLPKEHNFNNLLGFLIDATDSRNEINEMFELSVRVVAEVLSAKIVSIMLLDEERKELFIKDAYGLNREIVRNARVKVGSSVAGKVAESGKPLLIENIEEVGVTDGNRKSQYETKSLISVPLVIGSTILGVINVNNKISGKSFNEDDLDLLKSLSMRISKVIERMRMSQDFNAFLNETIHSLRSLLEIFERDKSGLRQESVDWTVKVAKKLDLERKEIRVIQFVSSVHDIGMSCVSEDILNKTLSLSSKDINKIRSHPQRGTDLLRPFEFVEKVSKIVLFHHEHFDGKGYPMGLKGDQIPIGSRILAVIDAYVAMVSKKPYREELTVIEAVEELMKNSGTQFDAAIVSAFIDVLMDEGHMEVEEYLNITDRMKAKLSNRILH
ncbi:MAG TPA: HD domain-containing phosphohydrolase [Candidatus Krumholzibacteriaceae bacterium]|nr:HD domain-containing phosphohydrolase [Candidatus Krumholzibacteriaceae bacterium]